MNGIEIFYPVSANILLVISLFFLLVNRRGKAAKTGEVDLSKTALDTSVWTQDVVKVSNNIANQFETPILFYVVCVMTFLAGAVDSISIALAWAYFGVRCVHAYIHTSSNIVAYRMRVFAVSIFIILALLVRLVIHMASLA